ncbi:MAG: nicotinate-nucleotide--dimethylbenzimidazole phosphoribosyltransferase [Planctomycetaceae bacterium]|nr:nicotinate-nucleotide--dimethylbenzimidazole phosphoribosyltransferase [Planctomycetaceae bacterium]
MMELLEQTVAAVRPLDEAAMREAEARVRNLTMPDWALGRLCDLAVQLSGISGIVPAPIARRVIVVMAGDHGVVAEGVARHKQEVTQQMVANMTNGGAGVNVLGRMNGATVLLADLGIAARDESLVTGGKLLDYSVGKGTANLAKGPAMSREDAVRSLENGIRIAGSLAGDYDVFGTGEMGIGNTTPATAIAACLLKTSPDALTGPGAGLTPEAVHHKIGVIKTALAVNQPDPNDAIDVLAKVGGYEIGGIAGLILGAAAARKPVLVDGFISTAGAMLARVLCPETVNYAILAHGSAEPGHYVMCDWLGQKPLLDLGMRLGEGTGVAMGLNIIEASHRMLTEMATFDSAGVDARHPGA